MSLILPPLSVNTPKSKSNLNTQCNEIFYFGDVFLPIYFPTFQIAQILQRVVLIDVSAAHLEANQTLHHTQLHAQSALDTPPLTKPIKHVVSVF